jgi:Fe-S oxidoreductase
MQDFWKKNIAFACVYSFFCVPLHPDYLQGGVVPDRYASPQGRITIMDIYLKTSNKQ